MKIIKKEHKALLFEGFFKLVGTPQGDRPQPKTYEFDKLAEVTTSYKKLKDSIVDNKFTDGEIEFTTAEATVLKNNFDEELKRLATPENGIFLIELKNVFDGK